MSGHFKDAILDALAERANVAQFVGFDTALTQRYSRIFGLAANHRFADLRDAATTLLATSAEKSVNVRSYDPASPKSREFVYGLKTVDAIVANVERLAAEGLHTLINETVDINDGGVSGVLLGDVIEFAPGDTPRCVEKPGTAAFPRRMGLDALRCVYGRRPLIEEYGPDTRVEFSVHPLPRGTRHTNTIIWELEDVGASPAVAQIRWPNKFSAHIGDKTYGLIVADMIPLLVPHTLVVARNVAPFTFGLRTGTGETWLRTAPRVQTPGKFLTQRGWVDPYKVLAEDTAGLIGAVLAQDGVNAAFAGAAIASSHDDILIEGVAGFGDEFMLGRAAPITLPTDVQESVRGVCTRAVSALGPVKIEWAYEQSRGVTWVVQLHVAERSSGSMIYPGSPPAYRQFDTTRGIDALREEVALAVADGVGIDLVGDVGITSHLGDVLRQAQVPSRLVTA